jgi:hypothetical protein
MSLAMTGSAITIHEKTVVPGDYVPYDVLYETDTWQGPEVQKQAAPIPLEVKQFGADPQKETINKMTEAIGSMMDKKLSTVISNKALINKRDWR